MKLIFLGFCLILAAASFAQEGDSLLDTLTKPADSGSSALEAGTESVEGADGSAEASTEAEDADSADSEEDVGTESAPEENGAEAVEEFDEEEFWKNYDGPDVTVIYDERSEVDYVIVQTDAEYAEFHYLNHIGYGDLMFVLTDLLKRITNEGYLHASGIVTEYKQNREVALIYRIDKTDNTAYGIVQFPDFSIFVRAKKDAQAGFPYNVSSPNHMMALVYQFTMALAEVEQRLGVNQMEYTKRFFKNE